MSDFSSLELEQPIEQNSLIDTFRQPVWIALFASLAIHAILGINLPKLSLFTEKAKLPPTVGLVELTPEQLERLPQPEEPEITFSTIPEASNFSPVVPPAQSELPLIPQSPSSELPEIPIDPSDYNLPELPPEDSTTSSSSNTYSSTPSVSNLPRNSPPVEFSYNYPSIPQGRTPSPRTPIYSPLPNIDSQPIDDIFPVNPPQEENPLQNQNEIQIDEYQIRKNLNLTDKVYDSGLSRRQTLEINPQEETAVIENSTGKSYSANIKLPPQRYQDKVENQTVTAKENNNDTQTETTPIAQATPEIPEKPDPTKKGRLPEAPLTTKLREGKTIQEIAESAKQQQKIAVATPPPTETNKPPEETPSVAPTPQTSPTPEQPKEFKGSLLEKLKQPQQQEVAETPPAPQPSPTPKENIAAATVEETNEETKPATPEVKVTPAVTPTPEPSPQVQQQEEFKGSLLQKMQQQKQQNDRVTEEAQSMDMALGAVGAYMQWAIELEVGEESLTEPQAISNVYPEAACEQKLQGKATVGVLVSPDGTIARGPKLLLQSGYNLLDETALDAVSQRSFDSSDRSKLYQYEFDFDGSNCSAAKPTEGENAPTGGATQEQQEVEGIPIEVMPAETNPTE